jgi:hypothetical protein
MGGSVAAFSQDLPNGGTSKVIDRKGSVAAFNQDLSGGTPPRPLTEYVWRARPAYGFALPALYPAGEHRPAYGRALPGVTSVSSRRGTTSDPLAEDQFPPGLQHRQPRSRAVKARP